MSSPLNRFDICAETLLCLIIMLSLIGIPGTLVTSCASASIVPVSQYQHHRRAAYDALPLSFELNQGQTNQGVKFLTRTNGYVLFLTATEAVMALDNPAAHKKGKEDLDVRDEEKPRPPRSVVRMKLVGANRAPQIEGLEQLPARSN